MKWASIAILYCLCFLICVEKCWSQNADRTIVIDCDHCEKIKKGVSIVDAKDSLSIVQFFNESVLDLKKSGYLAASIDSINWKTDQVNVKLFQGKKYDRLVLKNGSFITRFLDKKFIKKIGAEINVSDYDELFTDIISNFENDGYPLAKISFDSIEIKGENILAAIKIDESVRIPYDHIDFSDSFPVKRRFIENYLNIKKGQWFSKKDFQSISPRLERLSYLSLLQAPNLRFHHDSAKIALNIQKRRSSFFDGFIGFLPNQQGQDNQETLITGKVDLKLVNPFKTGKSITFFWNRQKPLSQTLNLSYDHPLVFSSKLDIGLDFGLFKEDTAFITRTTGVRITGSISSKTRYTLGFQRKTGDLLSGGERNISSSNNLLNTDYEMVNYSLGVDYQNLDNYQNPRKGNKLSVTSTIGRRSLGDNANIDDPSFNLSNVEELRGEVKFSHEYFLQATKTFGLYHAFTSKHIFSPSYFLNDMFRLGGLTNLRGFNDNFFFASNYALSNLEARLYFESFSYLLLFYDQSWLYYRLGENDQLNDKPLAIGGGIQLDTGNGILKFVYAIGKSSDIDFDFRQSKVHIGFEAKF